MKVKITFNIICGKYTCAENPGVFCEMLNYDVKGDGSCSLFGKVYDKDGWIQRHKKCIALGKKQKG
jgi:hypothetical protein